jgi:hypothetical protein
VISEVVRRTHAFLMGRRTAYQQVFQGVHGEKVLADLAKFCRAHQSTAHADPHVAARLDGRREVWLRIAEHLNLSADQLWALYDGRELD